MTTIDPRFSEVPQFTLESADMSGGGSLGAGQYNNRAGGANASPQLSWSGFPPETKSFAVTVFDPDAASPGFWHWVVFNLPASVTSLDAGAGAVGTRLPGGATTLSNDAGQRGYYGAGPPRGTGPHRYQFIVHAVDVAGLDVGPDATPDELAVALVPHTLALGVLQVTAVHGGASASQT